MSEVTVRVTSLNESGNGKVNVNFSGSPVADLSPGAFPNYTNLTLNLDTADAEAYFPGQYYTLALTATTAPE